MTKTDAVVAALKPQRYWKYIEPGLWDNDAVTVVMSEAQILSEYWAYWEGEMRKCGKFDDKQLAELLTPENCIEDWVMLHWADEA